jgi:hypothetical protein
MKEIMIDWDEGMIPIIETKEEYLEHNTDLRQFADDIFRLGTTDPEGQWSEDARTVSDEDYDRILTLRKAYYKIMRAIRSI